MNIETIAQKELLVDQIEYKLGNLRKGGYRWEDIPIHKSVKIIAINNKILINCANEEAKMLANSYQCEVRWNYFWSSQGHYIQPELLAPRPAGGIVTGRKDTLCEQKHRKLVRSNTRTRRWTNQCSTG